MCVNIAFRLKFLLLSVKQPGLNLGSKIERPYQPVVDTTIVNYVYTPSVSIRCLSVYKKLSVMFTCTNAKKPKHRTAAGNKETH